MLSARTEHCKLGAFIALDSVSLLSKRHSIVVISDRQRKCLNRLMLFIGFNAKEDRDGDLGTTTDSALFLARKVAEIQSIYSFTICTH